MTAIKISESIEQVRLFQWANMQLGVFPALEFLHHVPNGGKRDAVTGARLKREGVKVGAPDIVLPVANHGYHGLYIELKTTNGKTSYAQKEWQEYLNSAGYLSIVCYGWQEASDVIKKYLR